MNIFNFAAFVVKYSFDLEYGRYFLTIHVSAAAAAAQFIAAVETHVCPCVYFLYIFHFLCNFIEVVNCGMEGQVFPRAS